jgi:hypothetical protein
LEGRGGGLCVLGLGNANLGVLKMLSDAQAKT